MRSSDHGTNRGYRTYGCRCDVCKAGHARRARERQEARAWIPAAAKLAVDDPRHGTVNAYDNFGCRCDPCMESKAAYRRELSARTQVAG